jgi:uncharacterized membrane protein YdjX (TVP38/TMEM64 family)
MSEKSAVGWARSGRSLHRSGVGRALVGWLAPLALLGALVALYFVWPAYREVVTEGWRVLRGGDRDQLSTWVRSFGAGGPLAIVVLAIAQTVVFVLPSTLLIVASVVVYGPWWGGLLAWGALLMSSALAYGVGRWLGEMAVRNMVGGKTAERTRRLVERYGSGGIVAARLMPVFPHDALSLVAGLAGMGLVRFLAATAIGAAPLVALLALLGESDRLQSGLLWVGSATLVLYAAWVFWDQRRHGNAPARDRSQKHSHARSGR